MCYDASDYTWGIVPALLLLFWDNQLHWLVSSLFCCQSFATFHPIFSFLLRKLYYKCTIEQYQHHIWAGGVEHGVWGWRSSQGWWAALLLHGPGRCGCLYPISWVCEWIAPLEALVSGPGNIVCVCVCTAFISECLHVGQVWEYFYMCAWGWACMLVSVCVCFPMAMCQVRS